MCTYRRLAVIAEEARRAAARAVDVVAHATVQAPAA